MEVKNIAYKSFKAKEGETKKIGNDFFDILTFLISFMNELGIDGIVEKIDYDIENNETIITINKKVVEQFLIEFENKKLEDLDLVVRWLYIQTKLH